MPRVVTLTTDFGSGSGYVAEVKGRLLHAAAPFTLVDIAHDVPPHDVRAAAWLVAQACPAFPPGTLHLVVIDPGVGTARRLVWARLGTGTNHQDVLCPDNGVLSFVLRRLPLAEARRIDPPPDAAATFHGRDALAPLAVRLLEGLPAAAIGAAVDGLTTLAWPEPRRSGPRMEGEVIHVDAFGNMVTNLPATLLPQVAAAGRLRVGRHDIGTIVRTYGDAARGTPVVLAGSQGLVEAAVVEGRASERLECGVGTPVSFDAAAHAR
jgi:S-adenosylmethionine hydrolase